MENQFFITVCMGMKKEKLFIPESTSLEELSIKVEELFSVHRNNQKLIWKGRVLNQNGLSLEVMKVKKGDIIMILGKSSEGEKDSLLQKLVDFEKSYKDEEASVSVIRGDIDRLCEPSSSEEEVKTSKKKLLYANEMLMKLLERIDGVEINIHSDEVRLKRKGLVQSIQKLMDAIDKDYARLDQFS